MSMENAYYYLGGSIIMTGPGCTDMCNLINHTRPTYKKKQDLENNYKKNAP